MSYNLYSKVSKFRFSTSWKHTSKHEWSKKKRIFNEKDLFDCWERLKTGRLTPMMFVTKAANSVMDRYLSYDESGKINIASWFKTCIHIYNKGNYFHILWESEDKLKNKERIFNSKDTNVCTYEGSVNDEDHELHIELFGWY